MTTYSAYEVGAALLITVVGLGVAYAIVRVGSIAYFKTRSEYDAWLRRTSKDQKQDKPLL